MQRRAIPLLPVWTGPMEQDPEEEGSGELPPSETESSVAQAGLKVTV